LFQIYLELFSYGLLIKSNDMHASTAFFGVALIVALIKGGGVFDIQIAEIVSPSFFAAMTAIFTAAAIGMLLRGLFNKTSQPYIWAWVIRSGLCAVALLSQLAGGATYSLMLSGVQLASALLVVGLLLRKWPKKGGIGRNDWLAMAAAGVGVLWWLASGNPLYGLLGVLLGDMAATVLGIRASVVYGTHEPLPFWLCCLAAASMATLAAANTTSAVVLLAPLFSCANALLNIFAIGFVRYRKRLAPAVPEADLA
jgi:hypothetical protein